MINPTLTKLALGIAALAAADFVRFHRARRKPTARREALMRWEDEGGAVPAARPNVGSTVGSTPAAIDFPTAIPGSAATFGSATAAS